ncbi:MAG: hypothetical protein LBT89_11335 [Planctomycetaceae bacterium]|jgi:hypothetical protein|nr:hypothetical protein [Planctomycetaceae bacterium]
MSSISPIRYSDGRTVYGCNTTSYAPTNPKSGPVTGGNTVVWNSTTRSSTVIYPRQGGGNFTMQPQTGGQSVPQQPRTTAPLPYLSTYKNPSTDKYGRYGVQLGTSSQRATSASPQTMTPYMAQNVSRYTTESNVKVCTAAPAAKK